VLWRQVTPDPTSSGNARRLRRRSTDAERRFWLLLRDRRLQGWKFRRQVPLGSYVVDFYCAKARLIVELDGGQHATQIEHDQTRTDWLVSQKYAVVRFWNNDVLANEEGVLMALLEQLEARVPLTLPLSREGRGNAVANTHLSENPASQTARNRGAAAHTRRHSTNTPTVVAKASSRGVPSPLAGEGQGEGVFDATKNINRTQKP